MKKDDLLLVDTNNHVVAQLIDAGNGKRALRLMSAEKAREIIDGRIEPPVGSSMAFSTEIAADAKAAIEATSESESLRMETMTVEQWAFVYKNLERARDLSQKSDFVREQIKQLAAVPPEADPAPEQPVTTAEVKKTRYATFRDDVAQRLIAHMEEGSLPWHSHHENADARVDAEALRHDYFMPRNANSADAYRGGNRVNLTLAALERGSHDPRWMTFNQIKKAGHKLAKGAKSEIIEFWDFSRVDAYKEALKEYQDQGMSAEDIAEKLGDKPRGIAKMFLVFNGQDIEGLPPLPELPPLDVQQRNALADSIVSSLNLTGGVDNNALCRVPHYSPTKDQIVLPPAQIFSSDAEYYATLLHEAVHATGHDSRTGRLKKERGFDDKDKDYAYEELITEFSAAQLCALLGIPSDAKNHASYLDSYLSILKQDKNALFAIAREADEVMAYLLETVPALQQRFDEVMTGVSLEVEAQIKDELGMVDSALLDTTAKPVNYALGDDVHNKKLNRIGSVRSNEGDKVLVRSVQGLETWSLSDLEPVNNFDDDADVEAVDDQPAADSSVPRDLLGEAPQITTLNTPEQPITATLDTVMNPPVAAVSMTDKQQALVEQIKAADVTKAEGLKALTAIKDYVPVQQYSVLQGLIKRSSEWAFYAERVQAIQQIIDQLPPVYATQNNSDAEKIVGLHYFGGAVDSYLIEKDIEWEEGDYDRSYGYQDVGYGGEQGYISVKEICKSSLMQLDLHFEPMSLESLKISRNECESVVDNENEKLQEENDLWDSYDFYIADHLLPSLINSDDSGLSNKEIKQLDEWIKHQGLPENGHWSVIEDDTDEFGEDEVSGLRSSVTKVSWVFKRNEKQIEVGVEQKEADKARYATVDDDEVEEKEAEAEDEVMFGLNGI